MTPYNEREVLKLLQEESTQRKGFELIVAQYSEQLYWQIRRMVLSHEDANLSLIHISLPFRFQLWHNSFLPLPESL